MSRVCDAKIVNGNKSGILASKINSFRISRDNKKLIVHLTRNVLSTGGGPLVMSGLIEGVTNYDHEICGVFTKHATRSAEGSSYSFDLMTNCALPATNDVVYQLKAYRISKFVSKWLQTTFPARMYFKLRNRNIRLVHTHYSNRIDLQAEAILEYLGIPMVWTVHSLPDDSENTIRQLRRFNNICRHFHDKVTVVAVSRVTKEFIQIYCPDVKIQVIHNGSDIEKSNAVNRRDFLEGLGIKDDGHFIVSSVARLNPEKGVECLIIAAKELQKSSDKFIFVHLGEGPLENELKALVSQLGLERNFFFLGHQKHVSPYLSLSDLFVIPSLSEAFGLSLLEALKIGLPSIVSDVGGIPEVTDPSCSIFVPPGDSTLIASAIAELSQDKVRLSEMNVAALKQASKFSLNRMISEYNSVYDQLINDSDQRKSVP